MSFLNSVLNNIGKPGERPVPPPLPVQTKRKAEDEGDKQNGKTSKTSHLSRPNALPIQADATNGKKSSSRPVNISYSGMGRNGSSSAPTTPTTETAKQLKKGSFREIMARAKASNTQEIKPVVGTITHKPVPKEVSRKKDQRMQRRKSAIDIKDGSRGSSSDRGGKKSGRGVDVKKEKLPTKDSRPQPSYSGTAKPKTRDQPLYKGTAGSRSSSAKPVVKAKQSRNEYAGTDDEIDSYEDDDDNEDGYSDGSEDMEAGYMDVEEEETAALRLARREDEQELQREIALKKQKEEKRRKMQDLINRRGPQKF